eukprot:COSAG02_NODE_40020_length_410_cov_0.633441_1_plen_84_part_01
MDKGQNFELSSLLDLGQLSGAPSNHIANGPGGHSGGSTDAAATMSNEGASGLGVFPDDPFAEFRLEPLEPDFVVKEKFADMVDF